MSTLIIIILIIITIMFSLWDSFTIKVNHGLKGWLKVFHIVTLWASLVLIIALSQHFIVRNILLWLPFTAFLVWTVKDATIGISLKRDMFYLGSGLWDKIWKRFPGGLLLFLKVILLGFGYSLIYWKI